MKRPYTVNEFVGMDNARMRSFSRMSTALQYVSVRTMQVSSGTEWLLSNNQTHTVYCRIYRLPAWMVKWHIFQGDKIQEELNKE